MTGFDDTPRMGELCIRGARLVDGRVVDLAIERGRIAAIAPELPPRPGVDEIDARGCLAIPGLVDGHAHLDKTLWGAPWHSHRAGPTVVDRIRNEREVLRELQLSPRVQSERLLGALVARGTTHIRTHVDVGREMQLGHLHAVQDLAAARRDVVDLQIVAFPQMGVVIEPGTVDLLEQAVVDGANGIGGLDPVGVDHDPDGQLDAIFAIAARRGCFIDIHLHDRGETGAQTIERIAERTRALGLRSRVAVSHAFCLGGLEPARLDAMVRLLLDNDIAVMTHGPSGGTPFPPIRMLSQAGVRLFTGSDGVRDSWTPLNTGDMLERAYLLAYLSGFRDDAGLELALRLATHGGAEVMNAPGYGIAVGSQADLVLVAAENAAEAVAAHPPRRWVVKRGRVVARDGVAFSPGLQ